MAGQAPTGGCLCGGVRFESTAVEPNGIAARTREEEPAVPSALRKRETRTCTAVAPDAGGCSPDSRSSNWLLETTRLAFGNRIQQASSLACVGGS